MGRFVIKPDRDVDFYVGWSTSAYGPYENVASIPIDVLRFWKIREGF
jgi:hypothetical protein